MNKIKQYYESTAINNSLLGWMNNPRYIKLRREGRIPDEGAVHFRIGGALDTILTDNSAFNDTFKIINVVRPTGKMLKFIESLPAGITAESLLSEYEEAHRKAEYRMSLDKIVEGFWKKKSYLDYYNAIQLENQGKVVLSKDEWRKVTKMKALVEANPNTRKFFYSDNDNIEFVHQLPIYWSKHDDSEHTVDCKALLDCVVLDHENKTVQPADLKSIGKSVDDFPISFLQFGYYRQAAWYTLAIQDWMKNQRTDLKDYKLLPFKFIVVESNIKSTKAAVVYNCTDNDIEVGLNGGSTPEGRYYRGVNDLLRDYCWHERTNQWDMPRDLYENNGERELNVFRKNTKES